MSDDDKKILKLVRLKTQEEMLEEVEKEFPTRGSDVVQEAADFLSSREETEDYKEPEVVVAIFYPGMPSLLISGVEDTNRVYVLADFLKAELQSLIAYKDAVAAGLVDEEEEYDPTLH